MGAPARGGGPPSPSDRDEEEGRGDEGGRDSHGDGGLAAAYCGGAGGRRAIARGRRSREREGAQRPDDRRWPTAGAGGAVDDGADRV